MLWLIGLALASALLVALVARWKKTRMRRAIRRASSALVSDLVAERARDRTPSPGSDDLPPLFDRLRLNLATLVARSRGTRARMALSRAVAAAERGEWDDVALRLRGALRGVSGTQKEGAKGRLDALSTEALEVGNAAEARNEYEFARRWFQALAAVAGELGLHHLQGQSLLELGNVLHRSGLNAVAAEVFRHVAREHEDDDELFLHALFGQVQEATRLSNYEEAERLIVLLRRALAACASTLPPDVEDAIHLALNLRVMIVDSRLGRKARELSPEDRARLTRLEASGKGREHLAIRVALGIDAMTRGAFTQAIDRARPLVAAAAAAGDSASHGNAIMILAECLFRAGRLDELIAEFPSYRPPANPNVQGVLHGLLARALARQGRLRDAARAYGEALGYLAKASTQWKVAVLSMEYALELATRAPAAAFEALTDASAAVDAVLEGNRNAETLSRAVETFGTLHLVAIEIGLADPTMLPPVISWIERRRVTAMASNGPAAGAD